MCGIYIYFYSSIILIAFQVLSYAQYNFGAIILYADQLNLFTQYRIICTWFASEIKINCLLARATCTTAVENIASETFATW